MYFKTSMFLMTLIDKDYIYVFDKPLNLNVHFAEVICSVKCKTLGQIYSFVTFMGHLFLITFFLYESMIQSINCSYSLRIDSQWGQTCSRPNSQSPLSSSGRQCLLTCNAPNLEINWRILTIERNAV